VEELQEILRIELSLVEEAHPENPYQGIDDEEPKKRENSNYNK